MPDLRVGYAPRKVFAILLGGLGLIGACVFLAASSEPALPVRIFGGFAGAFFGACLVGWLARYLRPAEEAVVVVDAAGVFDRRLARRPIPWDVIEDVGLATMSRQSFIVIQVAPDAEPQLGLTPIARWTRGPNRALGFDGLCVATTGLAIAPGALFDAIRARVAASSPASPSARV